MINLLEFYKEKIPKDDYYYRFYNDLVTTNEQMKQEFANAFGGFMCYDDSIFEIYDDEEAIKKFRDLCEPNLSFSIENKSLFYLICYYLNYNGYIIEEFPRVLARPPQEPSEFTTNDIRNRAFKLNLDDNGTVKYQIRRKIVEDLHFKKNNTQKINDALNLKFQEISTRNAKFENMAIDEKIKEILNLTENLLKKDDKYIELDYESLTFGTINKQMIREFKRKLQCFRHSSDVSINERNQFSEEQKNFIIDFGIMLCNLIYYNLYKGGS